MTEEQLEKAARKYCELAGLDPDAILLHVRRWRMVAETLRQRWMELEAISFAVKE